MAVKFDPTVSLGSILTALCILGSIGLVWGSLQSTLATHTTEIRQLQDDSKRHQDERLADRVELKDMVKDLKGDIRDVKDLVIDKLKAKN